MYRPNERNVTQPAVRRHIHKAAADPLRRPLRVSVEPKDRVRSSHNLLRALCFHARAEAGGHRLTPYVKFRSSDPVVPLWEE